MGLSSGRSEMFDEKKILKALMKGNGIYGDIFAEERTYTHIQLESGRIEKLEKGEDKGVGIRVINPWKTFYASTNSFDETHLIETALKRKPQWKDQLGKAYCCRLSVPH
jgi:predicted Zn-dependent protease